MHDKQVRRRRLAAFGFVVLSLLLLTASFGGSGDGLGGVQRGALTVLGPIEEGANRALKPARDLFGWVGDTVDAKQERDDLQEANAALEREITALETQVAENEQLKGILETNRSSALDDYDKVQATVISSPSNLFYSQVTIDQGSDAGVRRGMAVVGPGGLVGRISGGSGSYSVVTLITDDSFSTNALVLPEGVKAQARAAPNRPGELELSLFDARRVGRDDRIVTQGTTNPELPSLYPPNILLGKVTRIVPGDGNLDTRVRVKPTVDLSELTRVEVITEAPEAQTVAAVP